MGTLPSDEASDRLILNLEGFEESPPTFKQRKFIADLQLLHGVKFKGKTKAEASEFISEYASKCRYSSNTRLHTVFTTPEERGYPSDDYFD